MSLLLRCTERRAPGSKEDHLFGEKLWKNLIKMRENVPVQQSFWTHLLRRLDTLWSLPLVAENLDILKNHSFQQQMKVLNFYAFPSELLAFKNFIC